MSQFYHNSPARSDDMHIANQKPSTSMYRGMRSCVLCTKSKSIGQFFNDKKEPVFKYCRQCRGAK